MGVSGRTWKIRDGRQIRWGSGLEQQNGAGQQSWSGELKADLILWVQFRKIPEQVLDFRYVNCYWVIENETKPFKSCAELRPDCSAPWLSPSIPHISPRIPSMMCPWSTLDSWMLQGLLRTHIQQLCVDSTHTKAFWKPKFSSPSSRRETENSTLLHRRKWHQQFLVNWKFFRTVLLCSI